MKRASWSWSFKPRGSSPLGFPFFFLGFPNLFIPPFPLSIGWSTPGVRGERATREVKREMDPTVAVGQGGMTQADISARIGQLLYSMALQAATGQCQCPTCQAARELAGLLATQLRLGPPSLRPVGP